MQVEVVTTEYACVAHVLRVVSVVCCRAGGGARARVGRAAAAARGAPAARGRGAPREAARAGRDPQSRRRPASEALALLRRARLALSAVSVRLRRTEPQDMSRRRERFSLAASSHSIRLRLLYSLVCSPCCTH